MIVIPIVVVGLGALWFAYFRFVFRDEVTRALRKLPKFSHVHDVVVTPLGGGLTNRNYRVEIDGETYVLRIAGADSGKLLIDRAAELIAVRAAAQAEVAPEVVDHSACHSVSLTRFVKGKPITTAEAFHPEVLPRITRTMRAYHDHDVPEGLGVFSPFEVVRTYYRKIEELGVKRPAELDAAMRIMNSIEETVKNDDPRCLCHNDLLLGNFIDAGHKLHIIDWEYAGRGDRFFDLGNFAASLELTDDQEQALLQAYFGEARTDDVRRLKLMRLASDMRESTWGFLQSAISKVESPPYYLEYGQRFLDRFLAGAARLGIVEKVS